MKEINEKIINEKITELDEGRDDLKNSKERLMKILDELGGHKDAAS